VRIPAFENRASGKTDEFGETVYDPACGTGGMIIEAIRHLGIAPKH
jgi:type I restriction-modification system DNA methylase subunit